MDPKLDATAPPPAAPPPGVTSTVSLSSPYPSSGASTLKPVAAGLVLVVLAVLALVASRRRRRTPRLVEIVESSSLGPKRALVVARMGDELLLLGSSEGGVTLLTTRPAPREPSPVARPAAAAPEPSRFELILGESAEDVELRRKLAVGLGGNIR